MDCTTTGSDNDHPEWTSKVLRDIQETGLRRVRLWDPVDGDPNPQGPPEDYRMPVAKKRKSVAVKVWS